MAGIGTGAKRIPIQGAAGLVLAVFFLSGFSGLVYQVVWVKLLTHVFGVTTFAVSAVLSAFMGGLALGSYLGGRIADRWQRHATRYASADGLRLYGWIEVGIGACALALGALFDGLTPVYRALYPALKDSPYLLSLIRFGLSFVLLVAPTTLMGATLPLLVRVLVEREEELGGRIAALYAWNTFGAVAGSLASGYVLIGVLGLQATTLLAAGLNLLAGAAALLLRGRLNQTLRVSETLRVWANAHTDADVSRAVLGAMALSGFAALGYEVIWTRVLTVISDHSVYAFSAMVAVVLIGIALGSEVVGRLAGRVADPLRALAWAEVGLGLSAALSLLLVVGAGRLFPAMEAQFGPARLNSNPVYFFCAAFAVIILLGLCMGMTFPLAAQVYARRRAGVGQGVGEIYSANVLGAMLGAVVTGFVLVPLLGSQRSLLALAALNLVAALWLASANARAARSVRPRAALAGALVVFTLFAPDRLYRALFAGRYPAQRIVQNFEGVEAAVTVTEYGGARVAYLNGAHQANTTPLMLAVHGMIGHLPALLHPGAERALVIGLGGGATSGAVAQHVRELTIVELSAGVVEAARLFAPVNRGVVDDPRVRLVVADGRNYLLLVDEQYDLITADIIPALHAHSSNLYSLEYYQMLAAHLREGGLVSQWLDRSLLEHEQRIMLRTFAQAFPHVIYWEQRQFGLMLGSNQPIIPDPALIARKFTPEVAETAAPLGIVSPEEVAAGFRLADDDLRREVGPGLILTDDHPYNEYFRLLRLGGLWRWLE